MEVGRGAELRGFEATLWERVYVAAHAGHAERIAYDGHGTGPRVDDVGMLPACIAVLVFRHGGQAALTREGFEHLAKQMLAWMRSCNTP